MRFIGFLALAGLAAAGMVAPAPARAAPLEQTQLAQATPTPLPAAIAAQITAAINSGNSDTLASTISALIAANPSLANEIATFAVTQDSNGAPTIAVAAAKAVQAQGGDPTQVTLAIVAALEAQVQPAAGGGGGGLSNTQVANLVNQVITGVEGAVTLNATDLAALRGNAGGNQFSQYSPPVVNLPQASPH
ncbi:MAG TPA: hypothetical protein VNE82_14690 [Candidatus Binataceae bacterium]|nr:hypothetical protein [Candidatus Binataceae bacterium]